MGVLQLQKPILRSEARGTLGVNPYYLLNKHLYYGATNRALEDESRPSLSFLKGFLTERDTDLSSVICITS
jgi:hypothetical protein